MAKAALTTLYVCGVADVVVAAVDLVVERAIGRCSPHRGRAGAGVGFDQDVAVQGALGLAADIAIQYVVAFPAAQAVITGFTVEGGLHLKRRNPLSLPTISE